MAIKRVDGTHICNGLTEYVSKCEFQGLSTDTKPILTSDKSGSTFYCVDTKTGYIWHINAWYEV